MSAIVIEDHFKFNNHFLIIALNEYADKIGENLFREHYNNCNQILFLVDGEGSHWIDSNEYKYSSASIFIVARGQPQKFIAPINPKGYLLLFSEILSENKDYNLSRLFNFSLFDLPNSHCQISLSDEVCNELLDIVKILDGGLDKMSEKAREDITNCLLKNFVQRTEQARGIKSNDIHSQYDVILNKFDLLLTQNLQYSRKVKFYADLLSISPKKLNSITKTCWGKTAKEFLEMRIIHDSKKMLKNASCTIKHISYCMGFSDPTNFNKFFKKNTAITPQQFREQHNKGSF